MLEWIIEGILTVVGKILFYFEVMLAKILDIEYAVFEVFSGMETVSYKGSDSYLLNVFFYNDTISTLYWGMACISFALIFLFTFIALVRKIFDSSGEAVKATNGQILLGAFKSFLYIILMTAIVSAVIQGTSVLMQRIDYLFDNADEIANPTSITFTDEDYGTMFEILDTVGNYSLNPSYDNRYNINSCFNEIRTGLQQLDDSGVFAFDYSSTKEARNSWQNALRLIATAADISEDLPLDVQNDNVNSAILNAMNQMRNNSENFKPLSSYTSTYTSSTRETKLGKVILLCASTNAARNGKYNSNVSFTDPIRGQFYYGNRDIYNIDDVEDYFSISLSRWNHLVSGLGLILLIKEFFTILINCVARLFNIILLYIAAPPFIAAIPLDGGGKFKQWITAFTIQSLSIFGSIIAIRLLIIFIPIVLEGNLVLFDNSTIDAIAKALLIIGMAFTAQKATGMISGILADNAGWQSIQAGDVGSGLEQRASAIGGAALGAAVSTAAGTMGAIGSGMATATGLGTIKDGIGKAFSNLGTSMRENGGIVGASRSGWSTKEMRNQDASAKKDQATDKWRAEMLSATRSIGNNFDPGEGGHEYGDLPGEGPMPQNLGGNDEGFIDNTYASVDDFMNNYGNDGVVDNTYASVDDFMNNYGNDNAGGGGNGNIVNDINNIDNINNTYSSVDDFMNNYGKNEPTRKNPPPLNLNNK